MIFFTAIYEILLSIKRFIALFILKYVIGWRIICDSNSRKINCDYNSYDFLRKGKHVMVYAHTSIYESLIGYLVSVAYDIPLIAVVKQELRDILWIGYVIKYFNFIFIDRQKNTNTTKYISEELNKQKDFTFGIAPEGTRSLVRELKSGFFYIAKKTNADLYIARFNFEDHIFSIEAIANEVAIQSTQCEKIKTIVENEMRKEKPYRPERCHLVQRAMIKTTSLIRIERSILIYFPPFIIITIMVHIIRGYVEF